VNKRFFCRVLFITLCCSASALDFGLVIHQAPLLGTPEISGDGVVEYGGLFLPWVSSSLGENIDFYASAGLRMQYERRDLAAAGREWAFLPEIGRFELIFRPLPDLSVEIGRFAFSEPLGFVLSGLFDGVGSALSIGGTQIRAGAFYTGLLYKKTGYIVMDNTDLENYHDRDSYFASRRFILAVNWESPSFLDTPNHLDLGAVAQFDLGDDSDAVHSQYLLARWSRSLGKGLYMDAGAVLDIEERNGEPGFGFALSLSPFWVPPERPYDRLFFNARLASGNWGERLRSFKPVSTEVQGRVLRARLSALSLLELGYILRLRQKVELETTAAYFFRTDRETFDDQDLNSASASAALGGEVFAGLIWAPESWCNVNIGLGVFLPGLGGAYLRQADPKWRLETGLTLSF
jgi:hypothetical protein